MSVLKLTISYILDLIETVAVAVFIFVILYYFIFQPHQVEGQSMFPTFKSHEYLLTNKLTYRFDEPQRGQIIIFKAPNHEEYDYIKRIIGLPGDRVKISEGKFWINGEKLDESNYLSTSVVTQGESFLQDNVQFIVPENSYFVAGDNRVNSSDSRDFGPVPKENIVGEAWFRYWPIENIGIVEQGKYSQYIQL